MNAFWWTYAFAQISSPRKHTHTHGFMFINKIRFTYGFNSSRLSEMHSFARIKGSSSTSIARSRNLFSSKSIDVQTIKLPSVDASHTTNSLLIVSAANLLPNSVRVRYVIIISIGSPANKRKTQCISSETNCAIEFWMYRENNDFLHYRGRRRARWKGIFDFYDRVWFRWSIMHDNWICAAEFMSCDEPNERRERLDGEMMWKTRFVAESNGMEKIRNKLIATERRRRGPRWSRWCRARWQNLMKCIGSNNENARLSFVICDLPFSIFTCTVFRCARPKIKYEHSTKKNEQQRLNRNETSRNRSDWTKHSAAEEKKCIINFRRLQL